MRYSQCDGGSNLRLRASREESLKPVASCGVAGRRRSALEIQFYE